MTAPRPGGAAMGVLGGTVCLVIGLIPVLFLAWARSAGSLGKLSALGLWAMAALVAAIAISAGVVLYRQAIDAQTRPVDIWVAAFLALVTWSVGVLTLVPGLLFLRLTDDRSLDQYGARFFLEWAIVYLLVAAAAYALGRWSLQSLSREQRSAATEPLDYAS